MPSLSPFRLSVTVLFTASALSGFFKAEKLSYQDFSRKSSSFDAAPVVLDRVLFFFYASAAFIFDRIL
jgi:hypothetical protein